MDEYAAIEETLSGFIREGRGTDEAEFAAMASELHRFQRTHNEPYARFCSRAGAPPAPADWREIPAVPQSAFKHAALRAFPEEKVAKTFRTSGTTGEGFGCHYFRSTRLYDEAILAGWDLFGLPRLPEVILTLPPEAAPDSSLSHMMGVLRQRALKGSQRFCVAVDGTIDPAPLRDLDEPVLVLGTALAFLHLFERGEKFPLPSGSVALETGGYKGSGRVLGKTELYAMSGECFGIGADAIVNEYGMTELSSQFYARGLGDVHRGPPWTRALVIDPETGSESAPGGTGLLRIFDLANVGSVLAIQTQDLAVRRFDSFELLGRDPSALPRGCSRAADELISARR